MWYCVGFKESAVLLSGTVHISTMNDKNKQNVANHIQTPTLDSNGGSMTDSHCHQ